ncbi:glutamate--cysteine ligase [Aerococcus urinaehominis]|uniref:Glutathione biosynthesis bifunctional protein GshAB n=1 Tax=Aerococcus urinaehominis TaxID=128944 RepID=A0A0X8FM08_9LACT|nr:bifunctional glutamate--cysteine ligase GshA/glutathione synthetase GshB [Aerococcus urinaehominis]AMB99755.1 glutamate--cysteine ligase [Aerococcus urinaehominis]SDM10188.1 glutamate-cysteine ligase /glutathione synthase [Aerococcus urinaehominis]
MNQLQKFITDAKMSQLFQQYSIGVEKEGHRINPDGSLAQTPHPPRVDGSSQNVYIQRDFAESQLELVTPPITNNHQVVMDWLRAIHEVTNRALDNDEMIWPYSMPPVLPADDQIRVAALDDPEAVDYREYLVGAYGKKLQMISGIHFNFELNDDFIHAYYQAQDPDQARDYKSFKSEFYLALARKFLRYQWVVIYLFGASPYAHDSFYQQASDRFDRPARSLRNSHLGYINKADVDFNYDNLIDYAETLAANVADGRLYAEKEFYSNVRLRGANQAQDLLEKGIRYLEFRNMDIQGDQAYGLSESDIAFMAYFILYLVWLDEDPDMDAVKLGIDLKTQVAEEDPRQETALKEEGLAIAQGMRQMLAAIAAPDQIKDQLERVLARFEDHQLTPAAQIVAKYPDVEAWLQSGLDLAKVAHQDALARPYELGGFADMELSTQIILADAIQYGIRFEIMDRDDQLVRFKLADHIEYVKNGNITSKDSYVTHYLLENKEVTKQILAEAGFPVPHSDAYQSLEAAKAAIALYEDRPIVVKPKSTNMGIGISVFKQGARADQLLPALEEAFKEDTSVMLEDYLPGTEYRFFVLDGKCLAVLLRIPANVVGDGQSSVRQLVAEKNQSPLRGHDHRTPLEFIQLGNLEAITLNQQGYDFDSVIPAGDRVYLRDNSNISTGGDSVDVTDRIHPTYKQIAEEMARALDVQITGLDIMIDDLEQPANSQPDQVNYGLIEANFNPMMMMHVYPAQGPGVRVTTAVLAYLFPEKEFPDSALK